MTLHFNAAGFVVAGLCILVGICSAEQAPIAPAAVKAPPRPSVVVTIRMGALLNGLNEWSRATAELASKQRAMDVERNRRDNVTGELQKRIAGANVAEADDIRDELDRTMANNNAWLDQASSELDMDAALRLQDIHRKIRSETVSLAVSQGYDVVMIDDSNIELQIDRQSRVPARVQVQQQIAGKRLLYTNPEIDVTDDLIQRMNNAFKAP